MSTLLTVLCCIVTYVGIGAFYARSRAIDCYRRAKVNHDSMVQASMLIQLTWRTLAWPYAAVFDAVRQHVRLWMTSPIDAARGEAAALREEAAQYDVLIAGSSDPVDRDLMRKGQAALLAQAEAVDL